MSYCNNRDVGKAGQRSKNELNCRSRSTDGSRKIFQGLQFMLGTFTFILSSLIVYTLFSEERFVSLTASSTHVGELDDKVPSLCVGEDRQDVFSRLAVALPD